MQGIKLTQQFCCRSFSRIGSFCRWLITMSTRTTKHSTDYSTEFAQQSCFGKRTHLWQQELLRLLYGRVGAPWSSKSAFLFCGLLDLFAVSFLPLSRIKQCPGKSFRTIRLISLPSVCLSADWLLILANLRPTIPNARGDPKTVRIRQAWENTLLPQSSCNSACRGLRAHWVWLRGIHFYVQQRKGHRHRPSACCGCSRGMEEPDHRNLLIL